MSVFYLPCNRCWNSGLYYLINEALISRLRFTISLHPYGDLFFLYHIVLMPANEVSHIWYFVCLCHRRALRQS
jgi:hypothetical protein